MKKETLNPVPICEECGQVTRRTATTAGKGRYECTNLECSKRFRQFYIRGSQKEVNDDN